MNEGLMRIAMAVRWLGYLTAAGLLVLSLIVQYPMTKGDAAIIMVIVALIAGAGWVLSWIIEGFCG